MARSKAWKRKTSPEDVAEMVTNYCERRGLAWVLCIG